MSGWKKKLAALVLFHLAIALFLLLYDEHLNPELRTFLDQTGETVADSDNAFFAFAGFDAEKGKDIHVTGMMIADKFVRESTRLLKEFDRDAFLGQKLLFKGEELLEGGDERLTYFPEAGQRRSSIEKLLEVNQDLINRYTALYDYPHYRETIPYLPTSFFTTYFSIRNPHRLILWKIALEVQQGSTAASLNLLRRDTAFWKMILEDSQDYITRLVAVNALRRNYRLLSEILDFRPLAAAGLSGNDLLLCKLTSSERNMSSTVRRELEYNLLMLKQMKHDMWRGEFDKPEKGSLNRFLAPMMKINSSSNMLYEDFAPLTKIAALPAPEFAEAVKKPRQKEKPKAGCELLYNPTGTAIFKLGGEWPSIGLPKYFGRVHDLDGYISLVNLQLQVMQQQVKKEEIQDFLNMADLAFSNPYTGEPMQWDGTKECIYFDSIAIDGVEGQRVELFL
jgi:hypothetical protein